MSEKKEEKSEKQTTKVETEDPLLGDKTQEVTTEKTETESQSEDLREQDKE